MFEPIAICTLLPPIVGVIVWSELKPGCTLSARGFCLLLAVLTVLVAVLAYREVAL